MTANDTADVHGEKDQRRSVEAGFASSSAVDLLGAFDHVDALQSGPVMTLLEPVDIVENGGFAGFNASMIAVDRLVPRKLSVCRVTLRLLGHEQAHVLASCALVTLDSKKVISILFEYFMNDVALTPHGVDDHDGARNGQHVEAPRDCHDLVSLLGHFDVAKDQTWAGGEDGYPVNGCLAFRPLVRAAHCLAIDSHHVRWCGPVRRQSG